MEGYKKCERWKVKAGVTVKKQARKSARVWSKAKPKAQTNANANAKEINLKRREGLKVEKRMKGEINCWGVLLYLDQHLLSLLENFKSCEESQIRNCHVYIWIRQKRITKKLKVI